MNITRIIFCSLAALGAAAALRAGFPGLDGVDFNKLVDNAKDVGKMAKGAAGIGPQEERVIGGSVAVEILGSYGGIVRDEAIMQRVNLVGRTLAECSARPDLDWRFAVLDSSTVNAFSAPGGYVFITRGLYALLDDDDQLAGVLAHEIAHITQRHALKIVARGEFLAGASSIAARNSADVRNAEAQLQQFDLGINKIVEVLLKTGFDPKTEFEADSIGRNLAATAGYSRDGLKQVLQTLQQDQTESPKVVFSTHPPLPERIRRL